MCTKKIKMDIAALAFLLLAVVFRECEAAFVEVTPKTVTVMPNSNLTVTCRVGSAIQYCRIAPHGMNAMNLSPKIQPVNGVSYVGRGLQDGDCGIYIPRVTEANNGKLLCYMAIETESNEAVGESQITVARAPKPPELDLNRGSESAQIFKEGDLLEASCIVRDGRPAAQITWFLDEEQLFEGLQMPTVIDVAGDDIFTVIQNLSRRLSPNDNGRTLRCVANHMTLIDRDSQATNQLQVKYPPQPPRDQIDRFGYEIGKPGTISVEVNSNPRPQLQWTVGGETIKEGSTDSTGRIEVPTAEPMGKGIYLASLRLASIRKEDTEIQFRLTAYNDQGSQDYLVVISTSAEPQGLQLGAGAIIGIVVAILVLILIISLIIFARATGRWCFGGKRHDREAPECSDTESAKAHSECDTGDCLHQLCRRKMSSDSAETVEAADERLDQQNSASKKQSKNKDIVYAELDLKNLGDTSPRVKETESTEYAEIIYAKKDDEEEPTPEASEASPKKDENTAEKKS